MAVTALLAIGSAMTAFAGQWQQDEKGWRYRNDDGSYVAQDGKCYKNEDGFDVIDGAFFADKRYQFDTNGYMVTGWYFCPENLTDMDPKEIPYFMEDTHGYGGYWNYYRPDGSLVQFDYTPDGYWMDASGCWDFQPANLTAAAAYTAEQEAKRIAAEERNNASNNPTSIEQQEIPEDGFNYELPDEAFEIINEKRSQYNKNVLTASDILNEAAQIRAKEMSEDFGHDRLDGSSFSSILDELGIECTQAGENGAKGLIKANGVVSGWMNSPLHKAILLASYYDQVGIGCYVKDGQYYWAAIFITSK